MGGDLSVNITTTTMHVKLTSNSENRTFSISPKDPETLSTEIDPDV